MKYIQNTIQKSRRIYFQILLFFFFYHFVLFATFVFLVFLQVVTYYNQLHEVDEKMPCKDFELKVNIEQSSGNSIYFQYNKTAYPNAVYCHVHINPLLGNPTSDR